MGRLRKFDRYDLHAHGKAHNPGRSELLQKIVSGIAVRIQNLELTVIERPV